MTGRALVRPASSDNWKAPLVCYKVLVKDASEDWSREINPVFA